jgi:predicted nucleotide-binding protein
MPRRRDEGPPERKLFTPEEAERQKKRLQARVDELSALDAGQPDFSQKADIALDKAQATIRDVFGAHSDEGSQIYSERMGANLPTMTFRLGSTTETEKRDRRRHIVSAVVPRLKMFIELVDERTTHAAAAPPQSSSRPAVTSRRVFVVHGHAEGVKQAVARTLEKLDLEPIILHELPDRGRTVIEKLEQETDVAYAVVLMTADDLGGPKTALPDSYQLRARQNVLVELGLFLGKLGRSHVSVLFEPGVEMPSDYDGVLYTPLDPGAAWRFKLATEIHAAGIEVDLNKLR